MYKHRGFCGIGIARGEYDVNVGTLIRSAGAFYADYVYTVERRYANSSTSVKHERHLPVVHFETIDEWKTHVPANADVVAIHQHPDATLLPEFDHPEQAVYVLGAEDYGIIDDVADAADHHVEIPMQYCENVAVAGSIVLYDRHRQRYESEDPKLAPYWSRSGTTNAMDG